MSITIFIIILNVIISVYVFSNQEAFEKLCFIPEKVWYDKDWIRILSSGFLHANWNHLLFNMLTLYFFGEGVEIFFTALYGGAGHTIFILFYLVAIVVANLPDLYFEKDNYSYRAVGASGAVSAVLFAYILFNPTAVLLIQFFIPCPAVLFGVGYLAYSIYMAKRGLDNIGHLAHFGGAVFGFLFPLFYQPSLFLDFLQQISYKITHLI